MTPDYISAKMKLYDKLGDICAHTDVEFYSAAILFYSIEVGVYCLLHDDFVYMHILHMSMVGLV